MEITVNNPLIVLHLPRTGGTALTGYIRHRVNKSICPGIEQTEIYDALAKQPYEIYIGHFGIDIYSKFVSSYKVIFARDPLSRMYSMWNQIRRTNNMTILNDIDRADIFENWCYSAYKDDQSLFNQATLWLSVGRIPIQVKQVHFELAMSNVSVFDYIGLTESYQIFFHGFIRYFNLPACTVNYENSSMVTLPSLSSKFIDWFIDVSQYDYALYAAMQNMAWKIYRKLYNQEQPVFG